MGHLTLGGGGLPLELVGREVVLLAVERRPDPVLGDEDVLARLEPLGELVEGDAHLGADVGDQLRVEHERIARPAQRVERPSLQRSEGFRHIAHAVDCTEGL